MVSRKEQARLITIALEELVKKARKGNIGAMKELARVKTDEEPEKDISIGDLTANERKILEQAIMKRIIKLRGSPAQKKFKITEV